MSVSDRNGSASDRPAPLPARQALDMYFLDIRCRLLDLAALLDRVDRGGDRPALAGDPRLERIRQAIQTLGDSSPGRAERIQQIFSLPYDPAWERPTPR